MGITRSYPLTLPQDKHKQKKTKHITSTSMRLWQVTTVLSPPCFCNKWLPFLLFLQPTCSVKIAPTQKLLQHNGFTPARAFGSSRKWGPLITPQDRPTPSRSPRPPLQDVGIWSAIKSSGGSHHAWWPNWFFSLKTRPLLIRLQDDGPNRVRCLRVQPLYGRPWVLLWIHRPDWSVDGPPWSHGQNHK